MKDIPHKKRIQEISTKRGSVHVSHKANIKIGISGKRQISPEERNRVYRETKSKIRDILKERNIHEFTGYTSLAIGADTIFAEVVKKEFGQPLHIILPFAVEEYKKDFEPKDLEIFEDFIKEAGNYEIAETVTPLDNIKRNTAYYEAGKKIVDECDEMVIIWDGLRPNGPGGTAEILGYLSEKNHYKQIPYIKVKPSKTDPLHDELLETYERANWSAIKARDKYRLVWKWAIFLGWMTVVCFACKTAFHLEWTSKLILTLFEFSFVVTAYILIFFAKKRKYHKNYLHERIKAETFRLFRSFYQAGVRIEISDRSKEEGTMLAATAEKINQSMGTPGGKSKWYSQYIIKSLIHEQCVYHGDKVKSIGNNHRIFEKINSFIGAFFLLNLTAHLIHMFFAGDYALQTPLYKFSVFFNILLPATYAALEGFIYFNEWALLKKYCETARQSLTEAEDMLPKNLEHCAFEECYEKQAQALHLISSIMLTDNRNWNLLLENKDNYHLIV